MKWNRWLEGNIPKNEYCKRIANNVEPAVNRQPSFARGTRRANKH